MPQPYINTPHTNDASYLTNGLAQLDDMSPEKSFYAPPQNQDLISQMRNARQTGMNLKTPRAGGRGPLRLLPNGNQGKSEFTPLMKSATKNNMARRLSSKKLGVPDTPAYLKDGYMNGATPALPRLDDNSQIHSEHTSSSAGNVVDFTPLPQHASSSAQSTPLAQLPGRDAAGVVTDGNMMTLREQENIIDKIEKENFGLKMKIHFLEEAMSKRGGEFNQAALKENTDLKVNRITMQRELHKFKKNIAQAERDAEIYRLQLEEYRERIRRKQADETVRLELESLRSQVDAKEKKIQELERKQESVRSGENKEIEKLRAEIGDLEAEVRDKDRQIDDRDDQIDAFKMDASKESNIVAELEDEIESAKQQLEELRQDLARSSTETAKAKKEREDAMHDKEKAEEDLDELRDEMANKSFTTRGLSRQLEEKAARLEDDFEDLQERHKMLEADLEEKSQHEKKLQERLREIEKDGSADVRNLQSNLELAQQQHDTLERKLGNMTKQVENLEKDLQIKIDEKDLLQTRHNALTTESAELQKDLSKARKSIQALENAVDEERQRAAQNDNFLRAQHKQELDLLNEQIDSLHREVNQKENDHAADLEEWEAKQRGLEAASARADEKASGLQRTVDKLQDAQGTLSGREMRLQEALESEKHRHIQEEKVLLKQIEELNQDLASKRDASDGNRSELNNAKEELRISIREQAALKEKVAELEEEIEVLQADIEQEHDIAEQLRKKSTESADAQLLKLKKEKQNLQEELANAQVELEDIHRELKNVEAEREELEVNLEKNNKAAEDTFSVDQEKRELKRVKQRLEKEVERIKAERDNAVETNAALEGELNAEVERATAEEDRLNKELDQLRNKQVLGSENRDRELTLAKNKATRLEARVKDLENLLDNQSKMVTSPNVDVSGLKQDLTEARKNENLATKRENELKTANRDLKMRVNDLEKEVHEARLAELKLKSPSSTPPSHSKELAQLRHELVQARTDLKEAQVQVRELKRNARDVTLDQTDRVELQKAAKSSAAEIETLQDKHREQENLIVDLRAQLKRIREERNEARNASVDVNKRERQIKELRSQLKQIQESDTVHEHSIQFLGRDEQIQEMKSQLKRLREERSAANAKAEEVENDLENLQSRYENMLEKLSSGRHSKSEIREKEIRGLIKEVMWLKAKCRREERLRKDLAWSKAYLEQGEAMRVQCNQVDLRILREMGVELDKKKYEKPLRPIQKFRAGVFAVIAAIRMSDMEEQWRDARKIGEQLQAVAVKQNMSRSRVSG